MKIDLEALQNYLLACSNDYSVNNYEINVHGVLHDLETLADRFGKGGDRNTCDLSDAGCVLSSYVSD